MLVGHHIWKRRISRALFLTTWKRRKLSYSSKDFATIDAHGYVDYGILPFNGQDGILHIGVGSWLLVSTVMGNPTASSGGASNR